jgi:peroxiredoxin
MPALRVVGSLIVVGWAAAALPASGAVKLTPGQELIYSGTGEWKMTNAGGPSQSYTGPLQLSAVVTESDAAKGHTIILMRNFQPRVEAGQPAIPSEAAVATLRYAVDLTTTPAPSLFGSPIASLLQSMSAPLSPQAELKTGQEWRRKETLPAMPPPPAELVYTVTGESKVGDRAAVKIEKKAVQALPIKYPVGAGSLELTDYGQTINVDPATGIVLSEDVHGSARLTAGERTATLDYKASVSLTETRQLSADDLAARVKQAAMIDRVQQAIFAAAQGADAKQGLADATKEVASFRKEHASSPYAPALSRLDDILGQVRAQSVRESAMDNLKGKPAPARALKDLTGKDQTLAAYKGKVVMLNFFASWCGPCHAEAPHLEKEFWQKYRAKGVVLLGVNTGERGQQAQLARQFRDQHKLTYPVLLDVGDKIAQKYGVMAFPTNVLIDQKGVVRRVEAGFNPDGLQETLNTLLSGK